MTDLLPPDGPAQPVSAQERFRRLQAVFDQAVQLPGADRRSFVERECAGDPTLCNDALGMLEADGNLGVLDQQLPEIALSILDQESGLPVLEIGPYRLFEVLGEGGMGVVYLARREDVGNPVAVKLLRDSGLSPARRERFLSEQRLLAPLIHPSIARFYDAGTLLDGTPWFAMEYVDGLPVTTYCETQQSNLQQRLRLFREICAAVQYAHERAIIHRDLKPSNILVKQDGSIRLLDFGIAKQLSDLAEAAQQTQTLRLLTPAYAAPEQLRGEPVGVFTDIHALGVILYELITGRLPFGSARRSPGEVEQAIAQEEARRPSLAAKQNSGCSATRAEWADLDVLCLTALQKDPLRRYRSAEAFARDITHFLDNDPLESRSDSTSYRMRKFAKRNARALIVSASALAALLIVISAFVYRLQRAKDEAVTQAARSERIAQFMQHLFDAGEAGPSSDLRATDVLEKGVEEAQRLSREPAVQGDLFETLGEAYDKLSKYDRAAPLLRQALSLRRTVYGDTSKEAAQTLVQLGSVLAEQAKYDEGLASIRQGLAMELKYNDPLAIAGGRMLLGRALTQSGDNQEAIATLNQAIPVLSQPGASASELFFARDALGTAHFASGQFDQAQGEYQKALDLAKNSFGPTNPLTAEEVVNLGSVAFSMQNFPLAEKYYRSGLSATQAWYGSNHVLVATESRLLGQALLKQGRFREAEVYLRQALAIHEREFGNLHGDAIQDLNALGMAASKQNHFKEAESYFARVLQIEDSLPHKDVLTPVTLYNLADLKRRQTQFAAAEEIEKKAIKMAAEMLPPAHLYTGLIYLGMGRTLLDERRFAEAKPYLERAYKVLTEPGNPTTGPVLQARDALRSDYLALHKQSEAQALEVATHTPSAAN